MTDRELATRIIENDFERSVYQTCLNSENAKVKAWNRNAPENSVGRIEARAWDLTKAALLRMTERAA